MATIKGASEEVKFPADWVTYSGYMFELPKDREFYNDKSRGWQDAFVEVMWNVVLKNRDRWIRQLKANEAYITFFLDIKEKLGGYSNRRNCFDIMIDEEYDSFKQRLFRWLDREKEI